MTRWRRSERIGAIVKILTEKPASLVSLNRFAEMFECAKSTVSEDLAIVKDILSRLDNGQVETLPGAAGGVRYVPRCSAEEAGVFVKKLCEKLSDPQRILPGGYLYVTDCIYDPGVIYPVGEIFATKFAAEQPDLVVTVETKGIPLAVATAYYLNVPAVVARRDSRVTEGSSVSINYISGSSRRIQTMSLARRAMPQGARVLIIDDFMKAGGTVKGLMDLMSEFAAEVVGVGILLATQEPENKLVDEFHALAVIERVDETRQEVRITPASWVA